MKGILKEKFQGKKVLFAEALAIRHIRSEKGWRHGGGGLEEPSGRGRAKAAVFSEGKFNNAEKR